ncbi:MAG TPA: hypothetical protein VN703_02925 [Candidatus Sulfopaludibacter sp.]|nr:hypothetical protein [Candidatus Sulfopaludibacter sp.]
MRTEKLFKREDGTKVDIIITFHVASYSERFSYSVSVSVCHPRKRTFNYVNDHDNFTYRRLSQDEKDIYDMEQNLKYVTKEEIQETAIQLWNKFKPNF